MSYEGGGTRSDSDPYLCKDPALHVAVRVGRFFKIDQLEAVVAGSESELAYMGRKSAAKGVDVTDGGEPGLVIAVPIESEGVNSARAMFFGPLYGEECTSVYVTVGGDPPACHSPFPVSVDADAPKLSVAVDVGHESDLPIGNEFSKEDASRPSAVVIRVVRGLLEDLKFVARS